MSGTSRQKYISMGESNTIVSAYTIELHSPTDMLKMQTIADFERNKVT